MDTPSPSRSPADHRLHRWNSTASSEHSAPSSPRPFSSSSSVALLEDEFRSILLTRVPALEPEALTPDLSSLSLSSLSSPPSFDYADPDAPEPDPDALDQPPLSRTSTSTSRASTSSLREIDLVPLDAAQDLHSLADRMASSGYSRECVQAFASVRRRCLDSSLKRLGVEKLSISDVHRLPWESLEAKIRRWIRSAKACVRIVFASERRLCDLVFDGIDLPADADPFLDATKPAARQLLNVAEAVAIGRRSPEKLFKVLDIHDALAELLPDVAIVFSPSSPVCSMVEEILSRLAEAARGMLSEFENAVHSELSRTPVPGGTIHPLTRYVMNYISLISDYTPTLSQLIVSHPSVASRDAASAGEGQSQPPLPELDLSELENPLPLAAHLVWIIAILDSNLEWKSRLYKDTALGHLFVMNNVHYIVQKVKGSQELRELVGDDCLRRLTRKYLKAATIYQRAALGRVLHCLRDEGLHVNGNFSSGVSKGTLRERFRAFNAAFDEAHRTQAAWSVPDLQLREELRISVSENLLPAYRSFLGRYRQYIENGRHPEMYIKYSVEDLELAFADFFEGISPSQIGRRRSQQGM